MPAEERNADQPIKASNDEFSGNVGHSVLKNIEQTIDIPRVQLREVEEPTAKPIERSDSPEIPNQDPKSRYHVDGEIARGGMGTILKGRDKDLGRDLAIKVLLDKHKDRPEVIQRFIEEAQIGGQLQHPGIAPVYELGQFDDLRPFFSMKLVKGQTLSKLLSEREDPSNDRTRFLGIFEHVCQTMGYAHARGVIHRDLKPANIMVGAFGEVQVMDWGLAKVLVGDGTDEKHDQDRSKKEVTVLQTRRSSGSDIPGLANSDTNKDSGSGSAETQMGSVMGTPAYMPPEQALGEIDQLNQRSDVFGLGAILCEILTGQPPYVANDATGVFRLASRCDLEDAHKRLDQCDSDTELIALAKRCLSNRPSSRPADGGELAKCVSSYLESVENKLRESEIQRASQSARQQEQRKRVRTTVSLGVLLLAVLSVGIVGTSWQAKQASQKAGEALAAQQQADKARVDAQERLVDSKIVESRMRRLSNSPGQRLVSLHALDEAAELAKQLGLDDERTLNLRNEIIAALGLHDVKENIRARSKDWCFFAVFDPEGEFFVNGDGTGNLRVFRLSDQAQLGILPTDKNAPSRFKGFGRVSPDGTLFATRNEDGVHVWNLQTRRRIPIEVETTTWFNNIVFDREGNLIAIGRDGGGVAIYETETFSLAHDLPGTSPVSAIAFCDEDRKLLVAGVTASGGDLQVWDLESEKIEAELRTASRIESLSTVKTSDRNIVATGTNPIILWEVGKFEEPIATLHRDSLLNHGPSGVNVEVLFSPNGKWLAATTWGKGTTEIWDWRTGTKLVEVRGWCRQFSNDSSRIYFCTGYEVGEWEIVTPDEHRQLPTPGNCLDYSPDGSLLAIGSDTSVLLLSADDLSPVGKLATGAVGSVRFRPNGDLLVSGDGGLTEWPVSTEPGLAKPEKLFEFGRQYADLPGRCDLAANGMICAVSKQHEISIINNKGRVVHKLAHKDAVNVAFSEDGRWVITSCGAGSSRGVILWNAVTGEQVKDLWATCVNAELEFSPDGEYFVACSGELYRFWNVADWKVAKEFTRENAEDIAAPIAFTEDSKLAAIATTRREIKIVVVDSGKELARFQTPPWTIGITSIAFSPDRKRLVIGTSNTVEFWDLSRVRMKLDALGLNWNSNNTDAS